MKTTLERAAGWLDQHGMAVLLAYIFTIDVVLIAETWIWPVDIFVFAASFGILVAGIVVLVRILRAAMYVDVRAGTRERAQRAGQ